MLICTLLLQTISVLSLVKCKYVLQQVQTLRLLL